MISEPVVNEYRDPEFSTAEIKEEELQDTMIVKKKSKQNSDLASVVDKKRVSLDSSVCRCPIETPENKLPTQRSH